MEKLTVDDVMTQGAHSIRADATLEAAHRMMRQHRIRHLPVVEGGRLVGLVSERDLHLVETLRDVNPKRVRVQEAMTADPYTVAPNSPLHRVAATMADQKYGSAVVVERGEVVGVFTTTDALWTLAVLVAQPPRRRGSARAPGWRGRRISARRR